MRFTSDTGGNVAMVFALMLTVLVGCAGIAIDCGRATDAQSKLKAAADSAALAAAVASGNGASINDAAAIASQSWSLNAAASTATLNPPIIAVTPSAGTVTTSIAFAGTVPTTLGALIGVTSIDVGGTSMAQAIVSPTTKFSGTGTIYGDPHISGADGYTGTFKCPPGNWYTMLSDTSDAGGSGIEVNVSCQIMWPNDEGITDFSLLLGTHVLTLHQPKPVSLGTNSSLPVWPASGNWFGTPALDGKPITPGAINTNTTLYSGPEGSIVQWIGAKPGDMANQNQDSILITTPKYTVLLGFDQGTGWINITATSVGACGAPGGLWGKTLTGVNDMNAADFQVSGPASTTREFSAGSCSGLVASNVRLIQ